MKVTQEKLPDSQLGLDVEIPASTSKAAYEKVIKDLARSVNIPGFRKGKAPRHILLQRLGPKRVKAAALEELVQTSLKKAFEQENIDALGNFDLRSDFEALLEQYQPGQAITFSAAVDVAPTPELGEYQNLSIQAEEVPSQVQRELEDWFEEKRVEKATLIPVEDRPTQIGDIALVDFVGREVSEGDEPGDILPGTEASDFSMELEEARFIPGMVEGVIGMQPEETKEIPVTFPDDYPQESLAGKSAIFTVTVHEIKEKELPELDDEFASDVSEFDTLEELQQSLEKQFQEDAQKAQKEAIYNALIQALSLNFSVDLPKTMVEQEVDNLLKQSAIQIEQLGIDLKQFFTAETIPKMRENHREEAIKNLKTELLLQAIAEREAITVSSEALAEKVKDMQEKLKGLDIDHKRLESAMREELLQTKILTWLEEHNTVELVPKEALNETEPSQDSRSSTVAPDIIEPATEPSTSLDAAIDVTATDVTTTEIQDAEIQKAEVQEAEASPKASNVAAKASPKINE